MSELGEGQFRCGERLEVEVCSKPRLNPKWKKENPK